MYRLLAILILLSGLFIFIQVESDIQPIDTQSKEYQELSYVYVVQIQEIPPSMATLIDDSAYYPTFDPALPTEPIIGVETRFLVVVPEDQVAIKPPCPISEQCVAFVKEMGIDVSENAWDIKPNLENPEVGVGILLYRHIAIITKIESASYEIVEQNFTGCGIIGTRSIQFDDSQIRGFVH